MGKYIKNLYSRDEDVFRAFQKCGNLDKTQLNRLDLTDTRIKNYCREGYLKKEPFDIKGQKENGIGYRLTDIGKQIGRDKFGLDNYAQSQSVRHNLDVANKYLSLTEKERETALNERELRQVVQQRINAIEDLKERDRYQEMLDNGRLSMPDITYTTEEGTTICYDTITNNYGETEIQAKEETCTFLKAEMELNKI